MTDHSACGEVGTLLVLLAVAQEAIKRPDAVGYEIVSFKEIKILLMSMVATRSQARQGDGHTS